MINISPGRHESFRSDVESDLVRRLTSSEPTDPGTSSGFGPDRQLGCSETADILLAPAPDAVPEFVLEEERLVPKWKWATERFRRRLRADSRHVARFTGPWAKKTRGKLLGAGEQMREWVDTTTLLTFTGSPFVDGMDHLLPPTSFLQALTESRSDRRRELRRVLHDVGGRWITMRVIGAHNSGYPHEHLVVGTEQDVDDVDFEPVIGAHREHSPIAGDGGHGAGAISIESAPNREEPTGAVRYITLDVPGVHSVVEADGAQLSDPRGIVEEDENRARLATVLEATRKEAFCIDSSEDVDADWHL